MWFCVSMGAGRRRLVGAVSLAAGVVGLLVGAGPASAATSVTLTPIASGFPTPIGIDYYQPLNQVVMSVNYGSGGIPNNFDLVDSSGNFSPFGSVSGLTDEVYIAAIRSSSCEGGFSPGDMYFGTGQPGAIARLSNGGSTLTDPWVTLPGEGGLLRGGLFQDVYCVAGGDLIVTTTAGDVWRVTSAGSATELASNFGGSTLEGPTTVPNDPRYGPWAGKILVSDEGNGVIWSIDPTSGATGRWDGGGAWGSAEGVHVVPSNQNFFGVDFASSTLRGAEASQFTDVVGDVVLATEFPGRLLDITWDGTSFQSYDLLTSDAAQWEGTTFAPAGLNPIPPTTTCGSASDIAPLELAIDGLPTQATVPFDNALVGWFTGPAAAPASCYAATIDWGDGQSSSGTVQQLVAGSSGCALGCKVLGGHTYASAGHYTPSVDLCFVTCPPQIPITDSTTTATIAASPPTTQPVAGVGVLTSDTGPQCTATVVNLADSTDPTDPRLRKEFQKAHLNGNVVVTAGHCIGADTRGFMFAPGFTGIAPRYSIDFDTGVVSSGPFAGDPIGQAPYGVWGCSALKYATRHCGQGGYGASGFRDATVIKPRGADATHDYAFLVFYTAPPNEARSLVQVTGGLPIEFDASLQPGNLLRSLAYDIDWVDANKPNDTGGWFDLINPPETKASCDSGPAGYQLESCHYSYFGSSGGPRTCSVSFDGIVDPSAANVIGLKGLLLASPCSTGDFASRAPFMFPLGNVVVGVNKTAIHTGPLLDPVANGRCCTSVITPLGADAARWALDAERR